METLSCKCILESKYYKIVDEGNEKGGPFTFVVDEIYSYNIIPDDFWGDCYVVIESITGFTMGFSKDDFFKKFKELK